MTEPRTLARPYALAAYEFAHQHNTLDLWLKMLANINQLVLTEQVQKVLNAPNVDVFGFLLTLKPFAEKALDEHGLNFLRLLVVNRRLELAPVIFELFQAIKAELDGVVSVGITTAVELHAAQQKDLVEQLVKQLQKKISPSFYVDDAIIAGAVICVGEEYVLDGSLKTQLERLKTKF